jgi:hypothetical protein
VRIHGFTRALEDGEWDELQGTYQPCGEARALRRELAHAGLTVNSSLATQANQLHGVSQKWWPDFKWIFLRLNNARDAIPTLAGDRRRPRLSRKWCWNAACKGHNSSAGQCSRVRQASDCFRLGGSSRYDAASSVVSPQ